MSIIVQSINIKNCQIKNNNNIKHGQTQITALSLYGTETDTGHIKWYAEYYYHIQTTHYSQRFIVSLMITLETDGEMYVIIISLIFYFTIICKYFVLRHC